MSYATVEAAVLTVIQGLADFAPAKNNSSRGDARVLGKSANTKACVLWFGGHRLEPSGMPNRWAFRWTVVVDLWFRGRGEPKFYNTDIADTVQAVLDALLAKPTLSGTVGVSQVLPGDASDPNRWQGESGNWWVVSFPVYVMEDRTIAITE